MYICIYTYIHIYIYIYIYMYTYITEENNFSESLAPNSFGN